MDGSGTYKVSQGTKENQGAADYTGEFVNNEREGEGTYKWTDGGDEYSGEYVKGKREGQGVYKFKNGDIYDGAWKAGMKHGEGIYTYANGEKKVKGTWKEDKRDGELVPC